MARLDAFIDKLFKDKGLELTFESGAGAYIRTPTGSTPVIKQSLSPIQIVNAIAEVLPPELRPNFPAEGVTSFDYGSLPHRVSVRMEKRGAVVRAVVTPDNGPTTELTAPVTAAPYVATANAPRIAGVPAASKPTPAPIVPDPPPPREPPGGITFEAGHPRHAMDALLARMVEQRASDLHLSSGCAPMLRVDGAIRTETSLGVVSSAQLTQMLFSIAPEKNRDQWTAIHDTDFAHETDTARFRVNLYQDRNGIGAVLRQIPHRIITAEEMGLSPAILELCQLRKGLVLVTGPTGSGKSTTLASMLDYVNRTRDDHIITIEDPIEFVHPNKSCLINQREVGVNTDSFKHALRAALREDPDIVLVGEMRDLETVAIALETAETGHLVFGTLHTNTAPSTVDRIIDQFPADRQSQIRQMLSESLKAVIAQTLCKKIGGGRVPALEILLCTAAVANLIREGKTYQIPSVMQTNRAGGMTTLNDALFDLVKRKLVDPEEATSRALNKTEFKAMLDRGGFALAQSSAVLAKVGS
jgi:twitching motility protein PilT